MSVAVDYTQSAKPGVSTPQNRGFSRVNQQKTYHQLRAAGSSKMYTEPRLPPYLYRGGGGRRYVRPVTVILI